MTKAAVMAPRLEKKIYVMSCVCFRMHKHLFTRGLQEREGWSWRVGWGVGGGSLDCAIRGQNLEKELKKVAH